MYICENVCFCIAVWLQICIAAVVPLNVEDRILQWMFSKQTPRFAGCAVLSARKSRMCSKHVQWLMGGSCATTNHSQMLAAADGCGSKTGHIKNGTSGPLQSMSANNGKKRWKLF